MFRLWPKCTESHGADSLFDLYTGNALYQLTNFEHLSERDFVRLYWKFWEGKGPEVGFLTAQSVSRWRSTHKIQVSWHTRVILKPSSHFIPSKGWPPRSRKSGESWLSWSILVFRIPVPYYTSWEWSPAWESGFDPQELAATVEELLGSGIIQRKEGRMDTGPTTWVTKSAEFS
jgi:hypothetical protein